MNKVQKLIIILISILTFNSPVYADWPMAGHDPQRTSYSSETSPSSFNTSAACWSKNFSDYIPSKAPLITADWGTGNISLVYVPTSAGIYALNYASGAQVWFYPMPQPVGHSPTVDKNTITLYIPSLDKTIHAVNAKTGVLKWQTLQAGGGFLTNPLVANNRIYVGNRDGYVYAFNTSDGSLSWYFQTEGPVDYSPAISLDNNTVYIASMDSYAYALNALNGNLIAKSVKFQGHGFYSFWPVVYSYQGINRVLFARSLNYPEANFIDQNQKTVFPAEGAATMNVDGYINYHNTYPDRKSLHILNPQTLVEQETAPYMWWGNPNGNRYPPAIDNNGNIWALSAWVQSTSVGFPQGRYMGWKIGSTTFIPKPNLNSDTESTDEPEAIAIFGNSIWHGDGGDGADHGGVAPLNSSIPQVWDPISLWNMVGGSWSSNWNKFRYGNGLKDVSGWAGIRGTHGNQNPPVPLLGKAFIHRSNTVICLQQP